MAKSEQDHINAIKNGDSKGLEKIYTLFLPRISRYIKSKGGSREDAQDVFQDALIIIFEKCRKAEIKIETSFYSLLMTICRNIWGNKLQRSSRTEVTLNEDIKHKIDEDIEEYIIKEEKENLFWSAFLKLGNDCRKIMKMFFEKIKMRKIGEEMGFKSESYTKKRKHQCKEKMVEIIKQDPRYGELQ